jgi:hypothetical protein
MSKKILVIVLSETRAHELTFDNFKKNVIDVLNADLCVCIGVSPNYDYTNPFYNLAKYKFTYDEPNDFGDAFDYAYNCLSNTSAQQQQQQQQQEEFPKHWREFLKLKDQFLGGIKDATNQHPGSGAIQIFFRWFLLTKLQENDLINKYDRFIITRSDYIYQLPHPKIELLDEKFIWIPDGEHYGGYTDRHVILSKHNIEPHLNILNNFVLRSNEYFMKMKHRTDWNIERVIKFHLEQNNVLHLVRHTPYVMYTVRNKNGTTSWSVGNFSNELGYYIKYSGEYNKSTDYKNKFERSGLTIDEFYSKHI